MTGIDLADVHIDLDDVRIVRGVSIDIRPGEVHAIVGPNGSGKTTLLRAIYRSVRPHSGTVALGGDDLWRELSARTAAARRSVVAQNDEIDPDFTVEEVVLMGRVSQQRAWSRQSADDHQIATESLAAVRLSGAGGRRVGTLSGGEVQRVLIARALAQRAPVMVLDEPTNHLDIRAQHEVLQLVRGLGLTVLLTVHDLDHAAAVADRVTVIDRGTVIRSGPTGEVLTADLIEEVFGVRAHVGVHPLTGALHIVTAAADVVPGAVSTRAEIR